jgi:hypothetical protein
MLIKLQTLLMLIFTFELFIEILSLIVCYCAECHYAESHHVDCCITTKRTLILLSVAVLW